MRSGISAFINPTGEILERIEDENKNDVSVAGILVRDIPLSDQKTFYTKFGDLFAFITLGLSAILLGVALTRKDYEP